MRYYELTENRLDEGLGSFIIKVGTAAMLLTGSAMAEVIKSTDVSGTKPAGYTQFCVDYADMCSAVSIERNKRVMDGSYGNLDTLMSINFEVNSNITGDNDADMKQWKKSDYWKSLEYGGVGDCDDYAITKMVKLIKTGWPRSQLRLATATVNNSLHLVLIASTTSGDWVLDNLKPSLQRVSSSQYKWISIEDPKTGNWLKIQTTN